MQTLSLALQLQRQIVRYSACKLRVWHCNCSAKLLRWPCTFPKRHALFGTKRVITPVHGSQILQVNLSSLCYGPPLLRTNGIHMHYSSLSVKQYHSINNITDAFVHCLLCIHIPMHIVNRIDGLESVYMHLQLINNS